MVVMNDTAVGANRNINSCFLEVTVTFSADVYKGCCLSATDSLCLTCDTYGTAAYADFNEVCTALCEETESFGIDNISCTDFYVISVMLTNPCNSVFLPLGISFR